ncbi:intelectin-1a-like [Ciona intestinalis]
MYCAVEAYGTLTNPVYGSLTNPAASCLDLKNSSNVLRDGYYFIQTVDSEDPFKVYCDMTTSGGGWTLVASVHENDINGKCTTADMWFSNDQAQYSKISKNWENTNIFGTVKEATLADYKNIGYCHEVNYPSNMNKLVDAIAALSPSLISGIPDFYNYTYGTKTDRLQNGGNGTFTRYGMMVSL